MNKYIFIFGCITASIELFHKSCDACTQFAACEDLLVKTQLGIRNLEHPHAKQILHVMKNMEQRFFCVKGASKVSLRFDLPVPSADLNTIPVLLSLNGQPILAMSLMSIIASGQVFSDYKDNTLEGSQLNKLILHLGMNKDTSLIGFLREYMLLAEIAYIEKNSAVMSILPSVLSAATQGANLTEITEAAMFKESGSRILQMLIFVGLRTDDDDYVDEEHTSDNRLSQLQAMIAKSNREFDDKLEEIGNPHSDPFKWKLANEITAEPIKSFSPVLLYLLSSMSEKKISIKELLFILQSAPELRNDHLIPYLWSKESGEHVKLRTYLTARFLTPELFNYGPGISVAIALLS